MRERDLAPRTVGELLDAAFFVYRRRFARLVLVAMIVSLPALVVAVIFADDAAAALRAWWDILSEGMRRDRGANPLDAFATSFDAAAKMQPIAWLMGALQSFERAGGVVAMAFFARAALRREALPTMGAVFREALPRMPAAIALQIVLDFVLGTCMGCCLPVGFVLTVMFAGAAVAIALERGPMEASARASMPAALAWFVAPCAAALDGCVRSVRLTTDPASIGRGSVFLFFLLTFVGIADAAAMTVGAIFAGSAGGWFWAQHCSEAVVLPVWGLGVAFWFADLRARREGADLEPVAA